MRNCTHINILNISNVQRAVDSRHVIACYDDFGREFENQLSKASNNWRPPLLPPPTSLLLFCSQKDYVKFGPILVLHCRCPVWTLTPSSNEAGTNATALRGRNALMRHLTEKYMQGEVKMSSS